MISCCSGYGYLTRTQCCLPMASCQENIRLREASTSQRARVAPGTGTSLVRKPWISRYRQGLASIHRRRSPRQLPPLEVLVQPAAATSVRPSVSRETECPGCSRCCYPTSQLEVSMEESGTATNSSAGEHEPTRTALLLAFLDNKAP